MKCAICDKEFNNLDFRLRNKLRGICFLCAEEGGFVGMTLEEMTRCVAVGKAIRADWNATPEQRRHLKDMES
jgi:hypothetical protein